MEHLEYNVPPNVVNAIQSLYDSISIMFNKNGKPLVVNQGLRQGCGLSPLLFDLYINKILQDWQMTSPNGIYLGNNNYITTVLFADDQVLIANSEDSLQTNVTTLNRILEMYNMKISTRKTKSMAMHGKNQRRVKIMIDLEIIEQVHAFKYLGCTISAFTFNADLEENVQKYNKLNGCINRYFGKNMRQDLKIRMHNIISKPALRYGSETWVLRQQDRKRIEASEMRFLRHTLGVTLRDRMRSEDIRKELKTTNMVEEIHTYQQQWYMHVQRMPPDRFPRQACFYQPQGRRDIGRPQTRWTSQFR